MAYVDFSVVSIGSDFIWVGSGAGSGEIALTRNRFSIPHWIAMLPMPLVRLSASLLAVALSPLVAQSVTTAPVGAVSVNVNANSDQRFGVTLMRDLIYSSAVTGVGINNISVSESIPDLGAGNMFIRFVSGAAEGEWFQISSVGTSSILLQESVAQFDIQIGDRFEVRPFWTLATLFPQGGGIPVSSDVFNPNGFVMLTDSQAVGVNLAADKLFLYHDGSQGPAGWYSNDGTLTPSDNFVISPESALAVRNLTQQACFVVSVGAVPVTKVANTIVSRAQGAQDNFVYNPYPHGITLGNSGLVQSEAVLPSGDVFAPGDLILLYSSKSKLLNDPAQSVYFYYNGPLGPAGWYINDGSLTLSDDVEIPPGGAFVVRKSASSSVAVEWKPGLPYSL